jgi:hypothetical protein
MPNPWDRPCRPDDYGSATADEVYQALGRTLTEWEWVEQGLANIFAVLTGTLDVLPTSPAVQAYGAGTGFNTRIAMVEAAAEFVFKFDVNEKLEAELAVLAKQCRGWVERRNDVAHARVTEMPQGTFLLIPSFYFSRRHVLDVDTITPKYAYSAEQIDGFTEGIIALWKKLYEFEERLLVWRKTLDPNRPKSDPTEHVL